ncbi:hypothetical protein Tco_0724910 [Tanacetum coccineum]|uniref:CCHC-type domain-containing protein n=1 Tax=Tanacetum coccineum TaxID=301880 RepID=A0ABQ4YBF1_9ASTR
MFGYDGNGKRNVGDTTEIKYYSRNDLVWQMEKDDNVPAGFTTRVKSRKENNSECYNCNAKGHYAQDDNWKPNNSIIMMEPLSPADDKGIHEQTNHEKLKPIINISADDQIDSNIIFDDPYVENYGGIYAMSSNASWINHFVWETMI